MHDVISGSSDNKEENHTLIPTQSPHTTIISLFDSKNTATATAPVCAKLLPDFQKSKLSMLLYIHGFGTYASP
ncbi:hypothetical protein N7499_008489 [Penicillium canescens]|uniref:Uncharacterized protein n=1 Tax=Penicillium canescens TaxID=5083 RepID=A0AAD6HZC5_PENCN|nr:uncharacterized protein N7446_013524 [Penicillium canescens]KAJ5985234.1 hypothetical protein N7522_012430 [Penicillium canescens]KAJ6023166.1 hypothetical protein N7460_013561 [Penicillium canescens]KAJ6025567.1 hypothetical protein N7444_013246 [Penicillium canescens]KAJ6042458.1 hypothetical protein N7446_013524 [Penicillium canescens]KAJ6076508.1 hypothetical protein N7499_008489 [Penicillium canescens]